MTADPSIWEFLWLGVQVLWTIVVNIARVAAVLVLMLLPVVTFLAVPALLMHPHRGRAK